MTALPGAGEIRGLIDAGRLEQVELVEPSAELAHRLSTDAQHHLAQRE